MFTLLCAAAFADGPPGPTPAPDPADAERPTVAVVGLHQAGLDAADRARAVEALAAAVESGGRFTAWTGPEVAQAVRGREAVIVEEALLKGARQSLASGIAAAGLASWEEARGWAQQAVAEVEAVMPGANATADLWEALVLEGSTWLLQDVPDEGAARTAMSRAVAIAPNRQPDPAAWPPSVIELHAAVQREGAAAARALAVEGSGQLWVDGARVGELPTTVPDLRPGPHYLLVRGGGRQAAERVTLGADGPERVTLAAGDPTLGVAADNPSGRSAQATALYQALGRRSEGVDYVLLAAVDDGTLRLQLLDTQRGAWSRPLELPFAEGDANDGHHDDADDEAALAVPLIFAGIAPDGTFAATAPTAIPLSIADNAVLAELLTQPIAAPPPAPVPVPVPLPPPRRSKVGLVLGLVGGALVAGGAVTAGAVLLGGGEAPQPTGTILVTF